MSKHKTFALGAALCLSTLLAAATIEAATELARVNSKVISLEEFNRRYAENLKFFQHRTPGKAAVLEDVIKRELGVQEARRQGLDKDPEIQERINAVLFNALVERELGKDVEKIFVSDDEAREFYGRNPEIRTSHVFVAVPPGATAEQVKEAQERIQQIQREHLKPGKMSFAEVAQRFSEGVAAPMGGDIDYQSRDKLDPAYYETALKLKSPGQVSGVVRTQFGFHIIKLTAIRPWTETDKAAVKRLVFEEKRNQLFEGYMKRLRAAAKVTVRSDLLR
jgi:parvulin-like peptidyl-prolyl isomerase